LSYALEEVQVFYTFYDTQAVLLHGFKSISSQASLIKKTQQTPAREIGYAYSPTAEVTALRNPTVDEISLQHWIAIGEGSKGMVLPIHHLNQK